MNDLKILIDYLNPKKHQKENSVNEKYLFTQINKEYSEYIGDLQNNDIDSGDLTTRIRYAINVGYGDPLQPLPGSFFSTSLYAEFNGDEVNYYFAKDFNGVTKYITIENVLEQETSNPFYQDYSNLDLVFIQSGENLYYHVGQKMLYTMSVIPTEIVLAAKRSLHYSPKELGGLVSKDYRLDFVDARGNRVTPQYANGNPIGYQPSATSSTTERILHLDLNPKIGELYWYPEIIHDNGITLKYHYHWNLNENQELKKESHAIKIYFPQTQSFLAFVNLVYFNNGVSPFDYFSTEGGRDQKAEFFVSYVKIINSLLRSSETINEKLTYLYYIPGDFFAKNQRLFKKMEDPSNLLGAQFIWDVIAEALEDDLTNFSIQKEDIALSLLNTLKTIYDNKTIESDERKLEGNTFILKNLLEKKTSNGNSFFLQLFNKIDGENFASFNELMKSIWRNSSYFDDQNPIYLQKVAQGKEKVLKYDGPIALPYKSDKTLGFYHSNVDISWVEKGTSLDTILETGNFEFTGERNSRGAPEIQEIKYDYNYHPYQPIYLVDSQSQKTALKLDYVIPAFYLKAVETKKTTANIYTGIEYALDIVTTFSGVGNISKFRHLSKLASKAAKLRSAQKASTYATVIAQIKLGAGAIEISSGTLNTLLKLTGLKETKFGADLSEFLFWLEMASLSGEAIGVIKDGLRRSASKALNHIDEIRKLGKKIDDPAQVEKVIGYLRKFEDTIQKVENFVSKLPRPIANEVKKLTSFVEMSVQNKLLKLDFQGKTFMSVTPRGIVKEMRLFSEIQNPQKIAEFKKIKIELELTDELGRKYTKKYTDNIEVFKDYRGNIKFRAKFEEGRIRDADYINYTYVKSLDNPPYMTSPRKFSKVNDIYLENGDTFYVIEYNGQVFPGGFGSKEPITSIKELREKLSVIKAWKDPDVDKIVIRQYEVVAEKIRTRDGFIGPMKETTKSSKNFGKTYPGGGHQYEFIDSWRDYEDISEIIKEDISFTKELL